MNNEIENLRSQRNASNQSLSALRSKMKKLRNTHKTDFGPAIAYFELTGNESAASELKKAQVYNDEFFRAQKWALDQTKLNISRMKSSFHQREHPKSGWGGPVENLRRISSLLEHRGFFALPQSDQERDFFADPTDAMREGLILVAAQLTELAHSYKPWDTDATPDYSFEASKDYFEKKLDEMGPVPLLEADVLPTLN